MILEDYEQKLREAKPSEVRVCLVGTVSQLGPYGFYLAEGEEGYPKLLGYGDSDGVLVQKKDGYNFPSDEWVKYTVVEIDESTWD